MTEIVQHSHNGDVLADAMARASLSSPSQSPMTPRSQLHHHNHTHNHHAASFSSSSTPQRPHASSVSSSQTNNTVKPEQKAESKPTRRFAPQLVESKPKEHRGRNATTAEDDNKKATTSSSSDTKTATGTGTASSSSHNHMSSSRPGRKFTPQLISTAKRSFRQGHAVYPGHQYPNHMKAAPVPKSADNTASKYSYASLSRRQGREVERKHSFQIPDLPDIESSRSGTDEPPQSPDESSSTTPTTFPSSSNAQSKDSYHQDPYEELVAQRRAAFLVNQALAAFPNEQHHQPVSHFAIDRDDDSPSEDEDEWEDWRDIRDNLLAFRRGSTLDLPWEIEELRHHKHEAEMRARDRLFAQGHTPFSAAALAARHGSSLEWDEDRIDGWAQDIGIRLERAQSPPMLGDDITFVRCASPEPLISEEGHDAKPAHENGDATAGQDAQLWSGNRQNDNAAAGGLWHGTCKQTSEEKAEAQKSGHLTPIPPPRAGIITPAIFVDGKELGLPFRNIKPSVEVRPPSQLPPKPDGKQAISNMDEMLAVEAETQREFTDEFITQIYNYLSLGYPCLARDFDVELSKISGIHVEELRKDDQTMNARGYLTPPSSRSNTDDSGSRKDGYVAAGAKCIRWNALKLYIHEWARQQPRMTEQNDKADTFGVLPRRGSWGI